MRNVLSTEFPCVTAAKLESTLASDDVLVGFFNHFLSLPCFPESLRYNQDTGLFEEDGGQAQSVSRNIRLSHERASENFSRSASCSELASPSSHDPSHNHSELSANTLEESCVEEATKSELELLAATVVKQVLHAAERIMGGHMLANTSACLTKSEEELINYSGGADCITERKVQPGSAAKQPAPQQKDDLSRKASNEMGADQWKKGRGSGCLSNCGNIGRRWSLFKEFIKKTPGEGLLHLWMDIERMKATEVWERKNRCLSLMRSRFLMSSSQTCLSAELLHRLGLSTSTCWTLAKLHSFCPSRGPLLATAQMERMIQALCVETGAGLYFTHFCEQSGSQLWENAIYFWSDLQHYHELFYQEGLDPYRVQLEAQLLYGTFICSSAPRGLGLRDAVRRTVYERLMPAFEELFDNIEEHVLNILLEPWTLLVHRDEESYQQVPVQQETRRVESAEFRELQSLLQEPGGRHKQESCESMVSSEFSSTLKVPQLSESWSKVSSEFKGYRLGSLMRHKHEIGHFMKFLQTQDASVHLSCWLDLEQYRRIPETDTALREEKSSYLVHRYLNKKYFFGPDSPASIDQQQEILHLTGGPERLKLDCLINSIVKEIQDVVRSHIEDTWLPHFLSTAEFTERQKNKPKRHTRSRFSEDRRGRRYRRTEAWQCDGLWMSSSKEILSFRRVLLDPGSCLQFQHFVSLKGDFLENDVLFWLEVQRYKDLCHSHSDKATIEKKISTIISVFINSSVPPALQIHVPEEQAQSILEKRCSLGPYIFREAQLSVFSELLRYWPEFQDLRNNVRQEQLQLLLEQKRLKHRARVRRQRRKEDEEEEEERRRMAQEEQGKHESSFRGEDEEDEDNYSDEERKDRRVSQTQSRLQLTPAQSLTWSYSKYMAALQREELLRRRKSQLDASSTVSDSSSCGVRSVGTFQSQKQRSLVSRTSSLQRQRHNKGVKTKERWT
uniref:RGS domain-containing protein n=1 Tax=Knipowitschia caucasica TaxID=637954 RepID=A0AAV2MAX9_KNICA